MQLIQDYCILFTNPIVVLVMKIVVLIYHREKKGHITLWM